MDSLYLLIPIALIFCIVIIRLLFWSINSGQYDDLDNEANRILFDEKPNKQEEKK
jgi:cbb3-type cytochrome oxidase maturation protein